MYRRVAEAGRTVLRACFVALVLARTWFRVIAGRGAVEEEVYQAVVRLGPTAIKLAQVISTRPDLAPASVARRLESLQEAAPRFSDDEARKVVELELGAPIGTLFRVFPASPIASASLSQVYFATLPDGTDVAVKVQRPGIEPAIRRDVRILRSLAWLLTLLRPGLRNLHLVDAAAEFGRWTLRELDFRLEGENADEFRRNFKDWPDIHLPDIHWSHTRRRVLTMERVAGRRVKDMMATVDDKARLDLVRHLADMVMKMFVDDGFFHADLHPGNIYFTESGRIVLLDTGMVGRMNRTQADRFLAYWMAVGRRQRDRAFHHLLALAIRTEGSNVVAYRAEYERILDQFEGSTVIEKSLARTYLDVVQSGARHGVVFPSEMLLQTKALVTMEALCISMAPGFKFSEEMRPIVARRAAQRARPAALLDQVWTMLPDLMVTGECLQTGRRSPSQPSEHAFRADAVSAIASVWIDAADGWLAAQRDCRLPDAEHWPHLAALVDVVVHVIELAAPADPRGRGESRPDHAGAVVEATAQERWATFQRANRAVTGIASHADAASWRHGRPWIDAIPAAFLPLARVALARAEAALAEQLNRRAHG
jgi:predicted unusual protein kinase regulating ubiquinone biosynthesis (AarF/ABC1/UbiB family)